MKLLEPTRHPRLKEAVAVVFLLTGLFVFFSLASYHPFDPSLNTASDVVKPGNLTGRTGAFLADFFLQTFGLGAYADPGAHLLVVLEIDLVFYHRFRLGEAMRRGDANRRDAARR